jgi:GDSL-like Lipase/Acylhydrolase family
MVTPTYPYPAEKKRRKLILALCAIGVSLLVILILGELGARFAFPDSQLRYVGDPEALFYFEPNQDGTLKLNDGVTSFPSHINELGFRGGPIRGKGRNILVLGDSFTYGWGVLDHETFSAKLGEWFAGEVTVINGGQPGYGVFQMAATLSRVEDIIRPDLVVLVIWQGDLLRQPLQGEELAGFFKRQRLSQLLKSSTLLTHIYRSVERLLLMWGLDALVFRVGEGGSIGRGADQQTIITQHVRGWEADKERVLRIHEQARRYGKGVLLVFWPKEDFAPFAEEGLAAKLTSTIEEFVTAHGIPFVSVQSAMRSVHSKSRLMVPKDLHPSSLAHCLAAKEIAKKLESLYEVPSRGVKCMDGL